MPDFLRTDVAAALRGFRRAPASAAAAVVTLAVAAGLNLAMFGLIDRAVLSPPPHVVDPDGVFTLSFEPRRDESGRIRMQTVSYVAYEAVKNGVPAATDVAAWQRQTTGAVIDGTQHRVNAMLVSGSYFNLLGTRPRLGRTILPEDEAAPAGSAPTVISHPFWLGTLGGDAGVLGRRIVVHGHEFIVAGVMPPGFSGHSTTEVDVWVPFHAAMQNTPGWDRDPLRRITSILMRLPAGGNPSAAAVQSSGATDFRVTLSSIRGADVGQTEQRIAYWLTGVALLVFVIGLANTATLLLVRGAARRRDLAIRAALGATRHRLFRQVLAEAAILSAVSVAGALALSYWFDEAIRRVLLPSLAASAGTAPHIPAAAAAAGVLGLIVTAAVGALQIPSHLQTGDAAGASAGRFRRRTHTSLLLLQTTLSVVLLAGAGVFGRSLYNLLTQDFGMQMDGVVIVHFDRGPGSGVDQGELLAAALDRVTALPGVEKATPVGVLPFSGFHVPPISVPGLDGPPNIDGQLPFLHAATPEFFEILRVPIVEGRAFTHADDRGAPVVIVNEVMARTVWPGTSAVGKCIRIGFPPDFDPFTATGPAKPSPSMPCREVVGVARNLRQRSVLPAGIESRLMQYFVPFSQVPPPPGGMGGSHVDGLMLKVSTDVDALAGPIRRLVVGNRTHLPFLQVRPYADLLERQLRPWRLGAALLSLFAALALGVAAVGLYAAFAHIVSERRREMAIRIAIGARPQRVLVMVLREAAVVAAAGVLCGVAVTIVSGRWAQSLLFGTAAADPLVLGTAGVLMLLVAAAATWFPARNASRADPSTLLRAE